MIGQIITYPDPVKWERICQIPFVAALTWAAEVVPNSIIGPMTYHTAEYVFNHDIPELREGMWLNKVLVVVGPDLQSLAGGEIGLYDHDGIYWVMRRRKE